MDKLIEYIVSGIAEDEHWQGNLTDDERTCLLELARVKLEAVLRDERTRLVDAFNKINHSLATEGKVRAESVPVEGSARAEVFQRMVVVLGL